MSSLRGLGHKAVTAAGLIRRGEWDVLGHILFPPSVFYRNEFHFVCLNKLQLKLPRRPIAGFSVRTAGLDDLQHLERLHARGLDYPAKMGAGELCVLAMAGEQPAAMAWFDVQSTHSSPANDFVFPVGDDGCWSYWVEVHPDFRLRGALVRLWEGSVSILQERGLRHVYSAIEESNRASMNSHGRLGFERICRYTVTRVFGRTRYVVEGVDGGVVRGSGTWDGSYLAS